MINVGNYPCVLLYQHLINLKKPILKCRVEYFKIHIDSVVNVRLYELNPWMGKCKRFDMHMQYIKHILIYNDFDTVT